MATNGKSQRAAVERRLGNDRRKLDSEPPVSWERRRSIEPRRPEVVEMEMTPSQWDALDGSAPLALPGTPPGGAR
jgi:hypothetical protein